MADERFQSVYLEGLSHRREKFREACRALKDQCGDQTLAGDINQLSDPSVAKLYWLSDGKVNHPLTFGSNFVGRLPDNQVIIVDEHISRRHFVVVIHEDGRSEIYDIASKNGTLVNGKKIEGPTMIRNGDEISVCSKRLRFYKGEPPTIKQNNPFKVE
jgi:pSer/pThr/pTyr-binding forkhead associated (FHA) protein